MYLYPERSEKSRVQRKMKKMNEEVDLHDVEAHDGDPAEEGQDRVLSKVA